jgi:transposase
MEIASEELKAQNMDHHGLVASVCQDLGIADKIDARLDKKDPRRIVSAGTGVVAMILNGLGFTNRRLYLSPQFFESKPVKQLLGKEVTASQLDDHTLGKALDEISAYGSSKLFGEVAFEIAIEHNLLSPLAHLDSTSFSVEGEYEVDSPEHVVKLTHGHSKDHRPDLKQVMMSLVVTGESAVPIWMEPQHGNSSDKKAFQQTIKNVRQFQKELKGGPEFKWIADSALYTKEGLLSQNDYLWVSRVPENIKAAKELVALPDLSIPWVERDVGYKTASFESIYGGVKQRWLLVYSSHSYAREKKTFERNLLKKQEKLKKLLWHLKNEVFDCEADAIKSLKKISKQFPYHEISYEVEKITKHKKSGRPKKGEHGEVVGVKLCTRFSKKKDAIEIALRRKGRFILATNDLNMESFSDESILSEYKSQQKVERGFKFLKDPWFMVNSFFLKLPSRIEALMMVMTLCLMVYNVGQHRIRSALRKVNDTLPNQINKPIQNPTLKWIFQMMEGISIVSFFEPHIAEPVRKVITGLNQLRIKIIKLFGPSAQKIYGVA